MISEISSKYNSLLKIVRENGEGPIVLINACTHGHEKIGARVIETLKSIKLKKGLLITNLANEKAFQVNAAFIESDLNRIFPGKIDGTYEEQIAYALHPIIEKVDICIDIHSTQTMSVGDGSTLIVTKLDDSTIKIINSIKPPRVFLMNVTKGNALISDAKIGIGFEYGRDDEELHYNYIVRDIKIILSSMGMIDFMDKGWNFDTKYYEVFDVLRKDELILGTSIENFTLVKKGDVIGSKNNQDYQAPFDFIPILFGPNRYKDIYGFLGKEIKI